jgi:hypothetical protein
MKKSLLLLSLAFIGLQSQAQISGPTNVCMNVANTYSVATVASNYNWYTTPGSIGNFSDPSIQNPDFTLTSAVAQYTITIVTSAPTSTLTAVVVNNTPYEPSTAGTGFCAGQTGVVSATGVGTLTWYTTATGGTPIYTGSSYTTPPLFSTTTYYVEDTYAGCPSLTRGPVTVSVDPLPVVNITGATTICDGTSVTLTTSVTSGGPVSIYSWAPGGQSTQNISVTPSTTTVYSLSVVNTYGCSDNYTYTVTVNPSPVMDPVSNIDACAGTQVNIPLFSSTPPGIYNWSNSNTNTGLGSSGSGNGISFTAGSSISVETGIVSVTSTALGCTGLPATFSLTINPSTNIFGTATSTAGVFQGEVYLLQYNAVQLAFDTIQNTPLGSNQYTFYGITAGSYLLKVVPDSAQFPDIVPTYYGDDFEWDSATVITQGCLADFTADITMVEVLNTTGTNFISGNILEGAGFGSRINGTNHIMVPGGPLKGVDVKLGKNPAAGIQARTMSDTSGYYKFDSIPAGDYTIYVDIPGLPMDSSYQLHISATDTFTLLNYYADSNSVYPILPVAVGLMPYAYTADGITIFPNPAKNQVKIRFETADGSASLELTDINGRTLWNDEWTNLPKGRHELQADLDRLHLLPGVYMIRVKTTKGISSQKLVITE